MAAATADAAGATEGEAAAKPRSKLVLIVAAVVLLAGGGAGAWFAGLLPGSGGDDKEKAEKEKPPDDHAVVYAAGALRPLDPFIANLSDAEGGRYLKTTLQVEFVAATAPADFDARAPQIRDSILTLLTSKSFEDVRSPEGKQTLREDVIARLNQIMQRDAVRAIYFTEFIVQ